MCFFVCPLPPPPKTKCSSLVFIRFRLCAAGVGIFGVRDEAGASHVSRVAVSGPGDIQRSTDRRHPGASAAGHRAAAFRHLPAPYAMLCCDLIGDAALLMYLSLSVCLSLVVVVVDTQSGNISLIYVSAMTLTLLFLPKLAFLSDSVSRRMHMHSRAFVLFFLSSFLLGVTSIRFLSLVGRC